MTNNNPVADKKTPAAFIFIEEANNRCVRIEESAAMLHKALSRLSPEKVRDNNKIPLKEYSQQNPATLVDQQNILINRLTEIQDSVAYAVNRLEEFV